MDAGVAGLIRSDLQIRRYPRGRPDPVWLPAWLPCGGRIPARHLPPRPWSLCAAFPHRTDCCRPIRRRAGVRGRFACTLTRHFDLCSLPLRSDRPLVPDRRRITIRRQSGGRPCSFRGHPGPGGRRRTPAASLPVNSVDDRISGREPAPTMALPRRSLPSRTPYGFALVRNDRANVMRPLRFPAPPSSLPGYLAARPHETSGQVTALASADR